MYIRVYTRVPTILMEELFNGSLLRVEQDGGQVIVVEDISSVAVLWTEVTTGLVLKRSVSLYRGEGSVWCVLQTQW